MDRERVVSFWAVVTWTWMVASGKDKSLVLGVGRTRHRLGSAFCRLGNLRQGTALTPWCLHWAGWAGWHLRLLLFNRLRHLSEERMLDNETHEAKPKMSSAILERYFGDSSALLAYGFLQLSARQLLLLVRTNSTAIFTPHHVPNFRKDGNLTLQST